MNVDSTSQILVVDDSKAVIGVVRKILMQLGSVKKKFIYRQFRRRVSRSDAAH